MLSAEPLNKRELKYNSNIIEYNTKKLELSSMFGGKDRDEELRRLREEMETLKDQLRELSEGSKEPKEGPTEEERRFDRDYGPRLDLGERISDYVTSIVDSVMTGIAGELDRSVFIGPRGIRITKERRRRPTVSADPKRVAAVMSSLGNEHRIRILEELSSSGLYAGELLERLPGISASTLSSHLNVLEEAGMIVQEKRRGRYLITIPGRLAYRMANQIAHQVESDVE